MKLRFEKIDLEQNRSIQVTELHKSEFDAPWHYHPEWELTLIQKGHGKRFVGNNIEHFTAGDLVLLGPNLPHFWHSEGSSQQPLAPDARAIVIQFPDVFFGETFLHLPEMDAIRKLLTKASLGLAFDSVQSPQVTNLLTTLTEQSPLERILCLLKILQALTTIPARPLSKALYTSPTELESSTRLGKAYAYLLSHFRDPITLTDIANSAAMSPAAFSRFFKRMTNRNLWDLLNDLRVEQASTLLRESNTDITAIAFESGFGTLSSFNRHFQKTHGRTPSAYRKIANLQPPLSP